MAKEYRQNESHDFIRKDYTTPTIEILEGDFDGGNGNRYSLPYGLCKGVGIDTDGMTPREAWEAYTNHTGISKKQAEEAHWGQEKVSETDEQIESDDNPTRVEPYSSSAQVAIGNFRKESCKLRHEELMAVSKDGKVIVEAKGKNDSVSLYSFQWRQCADGHIVHNHPQGNTFLSDADIEIAITYGARTIEAVGYDGTIHIVELPNGITKENISRFFYDYYITIKRGIAKANTLHDSLPKRAIKTGRYFVNRPEGWDVYRNGASPKDRFNFPEYAKVVQQEIKDFSKTTEQKYGVKSIFLKMEDEK